MYVQGMLPISILSWYDKLNEVSGHRKAKVTMEYRAIHATGTWDHSPSCVLQQPLPQRPAKRRKTAHRQDVTGSECGGRTYSRLPWELTRCCPKGRSTNSAVHPHETPAITSPEAAQREVTKKAQQKEHAIEGCCRGAPLMLNPPPNP